MRGALQLYIEATTPYKVCDAVDVGASAIQKATESRCDLILLRLSMPIRDSMETASLLRGKLPHVKIVGVSTLPMDLENEVSAATEFDAVLTSPDGLSKLVETLKALMPEPPRVTGTL